MNKKIYLITLISISILFAGCSNKQIKSQETTKTDVLQSSYTTGTSKNNNTSGVNPNNSNNSVTTKTTNKRDNTYKIITNTYKNANITVNYPQISNLNDSDKQTKINKLIKDEVFDNYGITQIIKTGVIPYYNEPVGNLTLDVTYTIELQNANILSIKYLGEVYIKGGAHPTNELYTTNIDVNNVKALKLSDIVTVEQTFVKAFRKGTYIPWNKTLNADIVKQLNSSVSTVISDYNDKDLQTAFEQSDKPEGSANPYCTHSYLTKDGVVVSISVNHAVGDHAEFIIPYKSIKGNIKTDDFIIQ